MSLFASSPAASSSPSSAPNFSLFSPSQNVNSSKFYCFEVPIKTVLHSSPSRSLLPPLSSYRSSPPPPPPILEKKPQSVELSDGDGDVDDRDGGSEQIRTAKESLEELLVVRRPAMEISGEDRGGDDVGSDDREIGGEELSSSSPIDAGLSDFAKKLPIFEPERVESSSVERPLMVNLDLALYRAKVLARKFQYSEAERILGKCIDHWPEDGRPYVALGKILSKQSKTGEARAVYEKGCQATQGDNPYIWQCWAVLENRVGNIRRARELFDAATVADKRHIAAWHGWAILELKQGNTKKARNLLGKGIKYCGGNEYVFQSLALLEAGAKRHEQARYLFRQATKCNPKSCASWLAWAQLEMRLENNSAARKLFQKAVQASPKNRFAWHVWGVFEANLGNIDLARKLLKIGRAVNPRDPVLLQSLGLLEYKYSTANFARVLFRRASELDPKHQPVWIAWGWMEWKEGNLSTARELYRKALSIDSTSESAARCLQAWGVLEQRAGNLSAARRLFRSSLNVNSQSYVTWMTWASLEEDQGNSMRAEEIRNLYFQQRTEVVDDASWGMGFLDMIDPAIDSVKRFLNLENNSYYKAKDSSKNTGTDDRRDELVGPSSSYVEGDGTESESGFDLDALIRKKLSLEPSELDILLETSLKPVQKRTKFVRKVRQPEAKTATTLSK